VGRRSRTSRLVCAGEAAREKLLLPCVQEKPRALWVQEPTQERVLCVQERVSCVDKARRLIVRLQGCLVRGHGTAPSRMKPRVGQAGVGAAPQECKAPHTPPGRREVANAPGAQMRWEHGTRLAPGCAPDTTGAPR
jgi:hypothetical protein